MAWVFPIIRFIPAILQAIFWGFAAWAVANFFVGGGQGAYQMGQIIGSLLPIVVAVMLTILVIKVLSGIGEIFPPTEPRRRRGREIRLVIE